MFEALATKQMGNALRAFALLMEDVGATKPAADLRGLADALTCGGTETVASILSKIKKQRKASKRVAVHPATLRVQLERIAIVMHASGATAAAKDCAAILKLFAGDTGAHTQAFNAELRAAIEAPAPTAKRKSTPLDAEAIRDLADKLVEFRDDNARFDAALAEIAANNKIKNAELASIANHFLGSNRKFKSKPEILKAIKNRQLQDAIQTSRDRRIEKIAV
jgi:hypothetical protein